MDPTDPDFRRRTRRDLRDVRRPRRPVGYRAGWQIQERLVGLGLVVVGLGGLLLASAMLGDAGSGRIAPVLGFLPILMVLGGVGLIAIGLKQFLNP